MGIVITRIILLVAEVAEFIASVVLIRNATLECNVYTVIGFILGLITLVVSFVLFLVTANIWDPWEISWSK